ncbi:MAG: penicillin-binding protein [Ruminococcaceae bacterium]|nr:penicillin-binding protein [Oscillospiraceae bacterium]
MLKVLKSKKAIIPICAAAVLILAVCIIALLLNTGKTEGCAVTDKDGMVIAVAYSEDDIRCNDESYGEYCSCAVKEAVKKLSQIKNCSEKSAAKKLFSGCTVSTPFDAKALDAVKAAYSDYLQNGIDFAACVTSPKGAVMTVYSVSENGRTACEKRSPFSSIKPLSVYTPAIEKDIINWSTVTEDSPVKVIQNEDGSLRDWPSNASGKYSYEPVCVADAVKYSLNTVAVKTLLKLGVANSFDFLEKSFEFDLSKEKSTVEAYGEDEVLADLGLGYLSSGVSCVDMSGYYEIFITAGKYTKPYFVLHISDKNDKIVYEYSGAPKQVISEETAYIMNRMLVGTVTPGGTAEKAQSGRIEVGGKTGTGNDNTSYWFTGFTPEYIISVWHGSNPQRDNMCPELFADAVAGMSNNPSAEYPVSGNVIKLPYCTESGMLHSENCFGFEFGYYKSSNAPSRCTVHTGR